MAIDPIKYKLNTFLSKMAERAWDSFAEAVKEQGIISQRTHESREQHARERNGRIQYVIQMALKHI